MDTDQFLDTIFAGAQGVVVTSSKEDGYQGRRWKPGTKLNGVVYFCVSTVKDTNPRSRALSRKTEDLVRTYVIVLDDIGTKVPLKLITLSPTYKLESSAGNFQVGFKIKGGCEPERAAALLEALAQTGLTDPGAIRADRIMRVPGSLNDKYDPPFASRVVEWNPEVEYTYAELARLLGVTPTDVKVSSTPTPIADEMDDPVFAWQIEHGMVLGPRNPRGWYPVRCPQEHLHSGDVDHGTDYMPGNPGAFHCMHAHCQGFGMPELRAWIRQEDPEAELSSWPASRMEAFGKALAHALGANTAPLSVAGAPAGAHAAGPADPSPTPTVGILEALQAQAAAMGSVFDPVEPDRADRMADVEEQVLNDLIWVASEDCYWSEEGLGLVKHRAVDDKWYARMRRAGLLDSVTPAGSPNVIAPTIWLRRAGDRVQRAHKIVHRLGKPRLTAEGCLNIAPPLPAVPVSSGETDAVVQWLNLVDYLCHDKVDDADWFIDWCAMMVGCPQEKPGWHVILKGRQGTGKNLVISPLVTHFKTAGLHENVSASAIASNFNGFLAAKMITVDELKMTSRGSATPHDVYANVKAWTVRENNTITINTKHKNPYEVENLSGWVITSNEAVPLMIERGDRRFLVIETPRNPLPHEAYEALVVALEGSGQGEIIGYLAERYASLSADRKRALRGRAPMTAAKERLIEAGSEGLMGAIQLAIEGKTGAPWPDLMRLEDVIDKLKMGADHLLLSDSAKKNMTTQRVAAALYEAGAERLFDGRQIGTRERQLRLWCLTGSRRAMYEQLGWGKALLDKYDELQKSMMPSVLRGMIKVVSDEDLPSE